MGCDLVEATIKIKRNDSIFEKWGIIPSSEMAESIRLPEEDLIPIHVIFSVRLLPLSVKVPTEKNKFCCLILEDEDILTKLDKHLPTILFFHGGGMTLGSPQTVEGTIDLDGHALECRKDKESKDVIFMSVRYSLAPEHPFPAAPMEACSVVDSLLNQGFERLHILGVSCGGYLALVSGLEAIRGGHERKSNIRSICAGCPMLNPACDSLSIYQNGASSHLLPIPFLRWCYRIYLELPPSDQVRKKTTTTTTGDDIEDDGLLRRDSNRQAWEESKWYKGNWRRLVEPAVDVPSNIWEDGYGSKIINTTNAGDPLHEEGVAMAAALRKRAAFSSSSSSSSHDDATTQRVSHHDHQGSHWLGTTIHRADYNRLAKEWSDIVFFDRKKEEGT